MADTYEIAEINDEILWDDFVRQAVGGTIFSTSSWLRCAREATGGKIRCYGCYKNGRLIAGLAGLEQRRRFLKHLTTPDLTPHGGLLLAPISGKGPAKLEAEGNRVAGLFIEYLTPLYGHIQLVHAPAVCDVREFTWAGWNARIRYTYQIDLSDLNILWERVERRTRTVIRKAEKADFQLRPTDDLELFRRQYEQIYSRQNGPPPVSSAVVECFARQVLDAGLGRACAIESPAGEIASIVIFVDGFNTAYAWIAGADPAFNPTGATSLLYWKFFEQSPLKRFDFVGANIPAIAKFKRGFGGDLVPYYAVEGFGSAWVRGGVACKRTLQDLFIQ